MSGPVSGARLRAGVDTASLADWEPSSDARARLLEEVEGRARYAPFCDRVAKLFALAPRVVMAALESLPDARWEPSEFDGIELLAITAGPTAGDAQVGFMRGRPGARLPSHTHGGAEHMLMLEGRVLEDDGTPLAPGGEAHRRPGQPHGFVVAGDEPCVCAYRFAGGVHVIGR